METQKIVNLLDSTDNEKSKFATTKWYVIDSESKGNYSDENLIKFVTKSLESSVCDYSDAYILVTQNIVVGGDANTKATFKNCALFRVGHKLMTHMLTIQKLLILQCLYTI